MSTITPIFSHFPLHYQNTLIEGFNSFKEQTQLILDNFLKKHKPKLKKHYTRQVFLLNILRNCFGIIFGNIYTLITSENIKLLREYIQGSDSKLISHASAYRYAEYIEKDLNSAIIKLAENLQDYFYLKKILNTKIILSLEIHISRRSRLKKCKNGWESDFIQIWPIFYRKLIINNVWWKLKSQ